MRFEQGIFIGQGSGETSILRIWYYIERGCIMNHLDIQLAMALAQKYHEGQKYAEQPYFDKHICEVASGCANKYHDKETVIVAYLHDILEDTDIQVGVLEALFGDEIDLAVCAITKHKGQSRLDYLNQCKGNEIARKVKIIDASCNMAQCLKENNFKRAAYYLNTIAILEDV